MGPDRFRLQNVYAEGEHIEFTLEGLPADMLYEAEWEGTNLRGILSVDGEKVADLQGTKIDDGPSEYFDDARPARRR